MADRVYTSIAYAIVRLSIWALLLALGIFDGVRHRGVRSRGWQLYFLLLIAAGLFVIKNIAFLAICIQGEANQGWATPAAYGAYIFFGDIAEAFWIFLLLAISAGLCITRTDLGPHKTVCIVIPTIFLVTAFVVDYVLFAQAGLQAFDYKTAYASSVPPEGYDPETYDPATDPLSGVSPSEGFVFIFCSLANFMAFFMSWFYMYDTARAEWQSLQNAGAEGAQGAVPPSLSYPSDVIPSGADSSGVGHAAVPTNAALLEEGQNASHLYGDIVGEDLDAPKTVQDRVADRDKVRLMKQFFFAVSFYLIMAMVVFFLPMFVPQAVDAALLVAYDALLWAFLAGLLLVFRMRNTNQFLLLGEEGEGGAEMTTELGVMYGDGENDDEEEQQQQGAAAMAARRPTTGGTGAAGGVTVQPRYTLDEDEEDGEITAAKNTGYGQQQSYGISRRKSTEIGNGTRSSGIDVSSGAGDVNDSAAAQGVVVMPLPSPQG